MKETGDNTLMKRVQEGDRDAFGTLVDRHGPMLVGYLQKLTGHREEAEDIAQDAFLKLYQHRDRYRDQGHLRAWLFKVATNRLRDRTRRKKRWNRISLHLVAGEKGWVDPVGPRKVQQDQELALVQHEIALLPIKYRVPFVLHQLEEWSYLQIAELLGCREGTAKSRVFRAKKRLEASLSNCLSGDHHE